MAPKSPLDRAEQEVSNSDLLLYSLYRLGGAGRYVDVEDVFVEVWKLAPARFSWRKYPYPQYKVAHVALSDVSEPGLLMRTEDGLCRQLTAKGVERVESRLALFERLASGHLRAPPGRRPSQRVVVGLERHPIVKRFVAGEAVRPGRHEVATLLRCAPDAPQPVWHERWQSLMSAAADAGRTDLLQFLRSLQRANPEWFGGSDECQE